MTHTQACWHMTSSPGLGRQCQISVNSIPDCLHRKFQSRQRYIQGDPASNKTKPQTKNTVHIKFAWIHKNFCMGSKWRQPYSQKHMDVDDQRTHSFCIELLESDPVNLHSKFILPPLYCVTLSRSFIFLSPSTGSISVGTWKDFINTLYQFGIFLKDE